MADILASPPQLFLIDGSSFLFRAYHQALNQDPRYNARLADGLPTGALRLFMTKMLQIVEKGAAGRMPTHAAVVFDVSRAGWRKDLHPGYKSSRAAPPDDLKIQMPYMRHAVRAIGLHPVELEGYEADDLIATYARQGERAGYEVVIISADKDMMQLVTPAVRFFDFESGTKGKPGYRPERNYDEDAVREAWEGLMPRQIPDAQALIGDSSDDIPGVHGIGIKTAAGLIVEFGDVESLLSNLDSIRQKNRRETLLANVDVIRMSHRLARLDVDAPIPVPLTDLSLSQFDPVPAIAFAKAMELQVIAKRLAKVFKIDSNLVDPATEFVATGVADAAPFDRGAYSVTGDGKRLADWMRLAQRSGRIAAIPVAHGDRLLGIGIATAPGQATYLPCGHEEEGTLFGGRFDGQVAPSDIEGFLSALGEGDDVLLIGHDVKRNWQLSPLCRAKRFDDVLLMSYALENGLARHDMESVSLRTTSRSFPPMPLGTQHAFMATDPRIYGVVVAEQADLLLRAHAVLAERLDANARRVYDDLERPMIDVLRRMERRGVLVDGNLLGAMNEEFSGRAAKLEAEAHALAGRPFSISSPKQVGDLLFDSLGLPGGERTATGQWRTRASILEDLAGQGHRVAGAISDWRQIAKLQGSFIQPLLAARDATGRVHTTFDLAATPTARLVSYDPALQNIPVRTEDGRRIREAFVATPGNVLIAADYSQIELRVLAHVADVPELRQAFEDGVDVHALTASEVFGVPIEGMPSDLRRSAKAINFGIVYGISGFGLANQLGIPVAEASRYIELYFSRFPGIKDYMVSTIDGLRRLGHVETMFGRRIHFPGYDRAKGAEKSAIERAAINAPIQGSASDIVRRAMIRIDAELRAQQLEADMLLQVHDEIVLETRADLIEMVTSIVVERMEGAVAPDINMSVPLVADVGIGANWSLAH